MQDNYSNRELDFKFEQIMEVLQRIENQVIKTNGRVSALELWKEGFMAKLAGVIATISVVWVAIKEFVIK